MSKLKRWMILAVVLTTLLFCTACGGSKKIPDELLKQAIQNQDDNYGAYGLSITDFQVGNRNYDSNYKSESVSVSVRAENGDSSYAASYEVTGLYENKNWKATSVSQIDMTVLPKSPLPQSIVDERVQKLLQEEENVRYCLTQVGYCEYSTELEQNIMAKVQLCSNTQYVDMTREYELNYRYTLDGWTLETEGSTSVIFQFTDDLCGTWVASKGEESYRFVIDHIEGDTAYVKYQANFLMKEWSWGGSMLVSKGYDTLTPVKIRVTDIGSMYMPDSWSKYYHAQIDFETTTFNQGGFDKRVTIGMSIYPKHCPQWASPNGTVEDEKAYALSYLSTPDGQDGVNGAYILTKQ